MVLPKQPLQQRSAPHGQIGFHSGSARRCYFWRESHHDFVHCVWRGYVELSACFFRTDGGGIDLGDGGILCGGGRECTGPTSNDNAITEMKKSQPRLRDIKLGGKIFWKVQILAHEVPIDMMMKMAPRTLLVAILLKV